ncbi:MAG: dephospho-CoA kinase [Acetobacteraceae bacterium]|nr:dephospho-CoA kinase [Acetobacteraceae bacterium]MSP29483.1 dephospho-CoA kinase [Acetobacteraceae bacterium]
MRIIGLTGGIGMGKSTAAHAFRRARIPVFDADAAVHRMYERGGRAVRPIDAAFPGTVVDGAVDRGKLRNVVFGNPGKFRQLEHLVHPLVWQAEAEAIAHARRAGKRAVVIDNPLLFEMKRPKWMRWHKAFDQAIVVSAPASIQIYRVRLRGRMTTEQIKAVIAKQMPDAEKRRRADLVVRTGLSRNVTLRPLRRLILDLLA